MTYITKLQGMTIAMYNVVAWHISCVDNNTLVKQKYTPVAWHRRSYGKPCPAS